MENALAERAKLLLLLTKYALMICDVLVAVAVVVAKVPYFFGPFFTRHFRGLLNEHRFGLGSKLFIGNALSMLNKNLIGFMQSLFSVQSICTVRKGSACRVGVHVFKRQLTLLSERICPPKKP